VECFFAWIGRNRRFSRDVERLVASVEAFVYAASTVNLLRRMARCRCDSKWPLSSTLAILGRLER